MFEIAAKYVASIAHAHSMSDANKRTALLVGLEYLSLNDMGLSSDNESLADAVSDLTTKKLTELEFADLLYAQFHADSLKTL